MFGTLSDQFADPEFDQWLASMTPDDIARVERVARYLEGGDPIAGISADDWAHLITIPMVHKTFDAERMTA